MLKSRLLFSIAVALAANGCTSLEGSPRPVTNAQVVPGLSKPYDVLGAMQTFDGYMMNGRPAEAKRYRDEVIALYMTAMDANYDLFRRKLNSQRKGFGLGLNLATIGLNGAIPLAANSAKDVLGALAGGANSARTSVDKELYFDQALPALLAAMDAERIKAKTTILERMRTDNAEQYSMALAFIDLNAYQAAPSFERAIDKLTAAANADRQQADKKLETAVAGCDTDVDLSGSRQTLMGLVLGNNVSAAALSRMALRVGADTKSNGVALDPAGLRESIRDRLMTAPCDPTALDLIASDFTGYIAATSGAPQ